MSRVVLATIDAVDNARQAGWLEGMEEAIRYAEVVDPVMASLMRRRFDMPDHRRDHRHTWEQDQCMSCGARR